MALLTDTDLLIDLERAGGTLAGVRPDPVTDAVARVHADIWSDVAVKGEIICAHDLWIAATAVAHGFGLATRNIAELGRVEGLRLVTPSDDSPSAL